MIDHARETIRRAALRRQLDGIVAGSDTRLSGKLAASGADAAAVVAEVARPLDIDSPQLGRLTAAFHGSGASNAVIAALTGGKVELRLAGCRTAGALRIDSAVPYLAPLLRSKDHRTSTAAAHALGRIGGTRSADALLAAMQRSGLRRSFVAALARGAPDLYVETALCANRRQGELGAVALAAGLRRRRTAVSPLLALLESGTRRQRAICCHALASIKSDAAVPSVANALFDAHWSVRLAAVKCLTAMRATSQFDQIEVLVQDPDLRVRRAARRSLRRLGNLMVRKVGLRGWL